MPSVGQERAHRRVDVEVRARGPRGPCASGARRAWPSPCRRCRSGGSSSYDRALFDHQRRLRLPATTRARTPSGRVIAAPGVCPDGNPNSTGPGNVGRQRAPATSLPSTWPPGSSQPGKSRRSTIAAAARERLPRAAVASTAGRAGTAARSRPRGTARSLRAGRRRTACPATPRAASGCRRRAGPTASPGLSTSSCGDASSPSGAGARQRADQRAPVVRRRAPLEPAGDGRTVERDEAAGARDERQQRREVAVADDRLARVAERQRRVEPAAARGRCRTRRAPPIIGAHRRIARARSRWPPRASPPAPAT